LYVLRHPITRAFSLWRFGRQEEPFEDFATPELFKAWKQHVDSWEGSLVVRYEHLNGERTEFNVVLWGIHSRWGLTSFNGYKYIRVTKRVGWSPNISSLSYCPPKVLRTALDVLGTHSHGYEIANWQYVAE
jgi:hypothetical protein